MTESSYGSTTSTTTSIPSTTMPSAMNPAHPTPTRTHRRRSSETKSAWKTTEWLAYLATVAAIAITSYLIGNSNDGGDGDAFRADKALLYITIATVGYLVSRGLAKSGSRDFDDD